MGNAHSAEADAALRQGLAEHVRRWGSLMSSGQAGELASYRSIADELLDNVRRSKPAPSKWQHRYAGRSVSDGGGAWRSGTFRIQYVSDIHLEFLNIKASGWGSSAAALLDDACDAEQALAVSLTVPLSDEVDAYFGQLVQPGGAPYLALLGDIGTPIGSPVNALFYGVFLRWTAKHWRRVLVVLGNHEFYNGPSSELSVDACRQIVADFCQQCGEQLQVMHRTAVQLDGVHVLGCTLWYDCPDSAEPELHELRQLLVYRVNDYRRIYAARGRQLELDDVVAMHRGDLAWLEERLRAAGSEPVVVLSHHAPTWSASNPDFCLFNHPYLIYTDGTPLARLFRYPLVGWLFGHTHVVLEEKQADTYVCTNARGYVPAVTAGYSPRRYFECC